MRSEAVDAVADLYRAVRVCWARLQAYREVLFALNSESASSGGVQA